MQPESLLNHRLGALLLILPRAPGMIIPRYMVWKVAMATEAVNTSIRMGADIRDMYETIARATGRSRNELMAEALRVEGERQIREIAMIEEGLADLRAGRSAPLEDVVARLKERGMLPPDFDLADGADEQAASA